MAHEVELKLRIRARDVARLRRHPALATHCVAGPVTRKLTSIYYDTPALALLDRQLSLRVRRMAGGWFQAVKAAGHSLAGLHQRMEWEDIIAAGHPDFSKITDPALTRVFDDAELRAALAPLFTTEVRRSEWQLALPDGSAVEVALDLGRLVASAHREPIREVELELKHGRAAALFELALALQADIPLWIENVSKAERGYAHYRLPARAAVKAATVALKPGMSAAQTLRRLAWTSLAQLQGNLELTLDGSDIEGCHQMRVALRRLRAALRMFRAHLPAADYQAIRTDLAWLAGCLGAARDLDVLCHATLPALAASLPPHAGLAELGAQAAVARARCQQAVRAALQSQRCQRLLLTLGAQLEALPDDPPHAAIGTLAPALLARHHRRLRRHGASLLALDDAGRHQLRIAAKQLRYCGEFLAALYPRKPAAAYLKALAALQDVLGELNDLAVAQRLQAELRPRAAGPAWREAGALLHGWAAGRQSLLLREAERAWCDFRAQKPFWRPR